MQFSMQLVRPIAIVLAGLLSIAAAGAAQAVTKSMAGQLGILNPSVGTANVFERGPTTQSGSIEAVGTATGTSVGRTLSLPAQQFSIMGTQLRSFPGFAGVAQQSLFYTTTQQAARFAPGGGAVGDGGTISFCPPVNNVPPASGTGTGGNRSCTFFNQAGNGNWPVRIAISNNNPTRYGGALLLLREVTGGIWFVVGAPTPTSNVGVVSFQPEIRTSPWTPGRTNYHFQTDINEPGPNYAAVVTPNSGRVGTLISSLGQGTVDPDDGSGWGFKMTTGTISGSDIYPPTTPTPTPTRFFFSVMGNDTTTPGGNRNLVLVGGGVARSGTGGNLFHRTSRLSMTIPEPGAALALVAGLGALLTLARTQRRS